MFNSKSKRPSLLYIECKSRDLSRKNSRIYDTMNDTLNKENSNYQSTQLNNTTKKIDRTVGSLNKMYKQAILDQQNIQEQASMLMEDFNGKLFQRAELIGQFEELEELLEYHKVKCNFEYTFAMKIDKLDQQIQQLKKSSSFRVSETTAELIKDREQQHKLLREKIQSETQQALKQYFQQWSGQFQQIQNEYGDSVYQDVVREQEQQINQIITQQYNKKLQGIIQILRNYERLEKAIQQNIDYVDNHLTEEIYSIKQTMKQKKDLLQNIRNNIAQDDDQSLQKRVQLLELENLQLEQQLNEMTMKIDLQQQEILNKQKTEEIYNEILTGFDCLSQIDDDEDSSKKARSDFSQIQAKNSSILNNTNKNMKKVLNNKDESLHFSQLQQYLQINSADSCIGGDNSKCSSACQLSADDSLLLHFNELNLSMMQSDKRKTNLNMPLQSQLFNGKNSYVESQPQSDFIRLTTITEEQLSSKREKSKIDHSSLQQPTPIHHNVQNIINFHKIKTIDSTSQSSNPLTDQTKRFTNRQGQSNLQIADHNEITQKQIQLQSPYVPLFFNQQSDPMTQKSQKPQIFRFKDQTLLSDQIQKHKKSKSFDSTANKDLQQRKLFCNVSTNGLEINSKESQFISQKSSYLVPIEQEILKIMKPLQKGVQIYKRFTTTKPNLTKSEFDPFTCQNPSLCGYGPRIIALSPTFDKIQFKNQMRTNQVDSSIQLDSIMRVIIPKSIQQSILIKKQITNKFILSQEERIVCSIAYWPMSIITQNDGRIELLFENETTLEQWQAGIVFLKDNNKTLQTINKKLKQ